VTPASASYFHRGGDLPLLGKTIPEHFADMVRKFPDREAVVSLHQEKHLTYSALSDSLDHLARGLLGMGFRQGDRIGIWSTNNIEWLLLQMATARMGAILVNINPAYRPRELAYALKRSEANALFVIPSFKTSNYIDMLIEMIPGLKASLPSTFKSSEFPHLRMVCVYDPKDSSRTERPLPGFTIWPEVLASAVNVSQDGLDSVTESLDRDDVINIQYTSGTTGFPKAVMLTHHNILNNAWFSAQAMGFTEHDRLCVPVPFYHCFGMVLANLLCLSVGACIVIPCEYFDALSVLAALDRKKCTAVHGVPTMFIAELEHPQFKDFDLSSLRTGIMAGAPCPPALVDRVMHDMHCREVLIGYGETEASPITHLTLRDDSIERRIQTVGKNLPHQEVKVVDVQNGKTLPLGQIGEICFRGYQVMRGYYGDTESTSKAIDGSNWLHSGDLGTMDQDGYVRITGRLKDMIIRGGENIYPREVEDFLFTHPKVAEVAVFGVPDEFFGEEVMAWIKLHTDAVTTEEEIREFCKGNIAHFKIPKYVWFVEEFPMTVTGKLQKFRMREIAIQKLGKARIG
jgi:fatty-acyl-CoA synthase